MIYVLAITMILILILSFVVERTIFSPSSFFSSILTLNLFGTMIFAPEYYVSDEAMLYFILVSVVGLLGSAIGIIVASQYPWMAPASICYNRNVMLGIGIISATLSLILSLNSLGVSFSAFTSLQAFMSTAQRMTYVRYTDGLNLPLIVNVLNSITLLYLMIASLRVGIEGVLPRFVEFVPFILFVLVNVVITTRAPIVFASTIVFFATVCGIALSARSNGFPSMLHIKALFAVGGIGMSVVALFVSVQILRFGEQSNRTLSEIFQHLRRWPWGSIPGFSHWFDFSLVYSDNIVGYYTFTGILDNLGLAERTMGAFSDYVELAPGEPGNIYTVFRGLIEDFGMGGSVAFFFVLCFLGGLSSSMITRNYLAFAPIYVAIMCFIAWSMIISFYSFTSHIIAFTLTALLLPFISRRIS